MEREALELRKQELRLLETLAKENKRSIQAERKSKIAIEEARRLGRALKAMKGNVRQGVEKVTITENGITRKCNTPSAVERALFMEGRRRFSQTENKPPMNLRVTKSQVSGTKSLLPKKHWRVLSTCH